LVAEERGADRGAKRLIDVVRGVERPDLTLERTEERLVERPEEERLREDDARLFAFNGKEAVSGAMAVSRITRRRFM
jgi:hypothetical protein